MHEIQTCSMTNSIERQIEAHKILQYFLINYKTKFHKKLLSLEYVSSLCLSSSLMSVQAFNSSAIV
jgi:hypothetical protein